MIETTAPSPMSSPVERRITLRLLAYWEKMRGDRAMPTEDDINSAEIRDLWGSCFLVRVSDLDRRDYNYTYLGQEIMEAYRSGLASGDPANMISPNARKLSTGYNKVIITGKPVLEEGEFRNLNNDVVKYRQCLLPLGKGNEVSAVFGGMRFKIFPGDPVQ
ncbi:MAG: PAS domain-containing protein [Pseudomonadota bacterium]|nr:PAS domain-containing protein [Pseudomonadota bacterium]MDE3037488.1 PAS domain-containing protein [Pseudomonadota bacterium]